MKVQIIKNDLVIPVEGLWDLRLACILRGEEDATNHFNFVKANMPKWAMGHEEEVLALFKHVAGLGAVSAFNHISLHGHLEGFSR
jgi:hypothetical protein